MKFAVRDIRANPFRDIDSYPIDRDKIEALRNSIASTGFWDNIVARLADEQPEIAYGHHRLVALKEELGPDAVVDLIVRELDDATMLRIMADENMQEWTASAAIEQETIAAVVRAYADGRITLAPPPARPGPTRYAPSYRANSDETELPYSAQTVADFLRWPVGKVERALAALAAIEAGDLPAETFRGLGAALGERVVQAAHATERRAKGQGHTPEKAKEIGRQVAEQLAEEFRPKGKAIGTAITQRREQLIEEALPNRPKEPVGAKIAEALWREIDGFWRVGVVIPGQGTLTRSELIRLVAANRDAANLQGIALPWSEQLADALVELSRVALDLADTLRAEDALVASR